MLTWILIAVAAYFGFLAVAAIASVVMGPPHDGVTERISAKDWPSLE